MKKIGIISDTHGFINQQIINVFKDCDEIWHAGDIGFNDKIENFIKKNHIKAVYGNIDGQKIRSIYPKTLKFTCENVKVLMTHIGGYPGKYTREIESEIQLFNPDLYICGHSHILKIMYDKKHKLIHINPGSAGKEGFHKKRTVILLKVQNSKLYDVRVVELGPRTKLA